MKIIFLRKPVVESRNFQGTVVPFVKQGQFAHLYGMVDLHKSILSQLYDVLAAAYLCTDTRPLLGNLPHDVKEALAKQHPTVGLDPKVPAFIYVLNDAMSALNRDEFLREFPRELVEAIHYGCADDWDYLILQ